LKEALDDIGDALACLEVALFLDENPASLAQDLARVATRSLGGPVTEAPATKIPAAAPATSAAPSSPRVPTLVDLAVKPKKTREENALLGALALNTPHGPATDDALHHAAGALLDDHALAPRRLQWSVLHALAKSTGDKLALVRAKEGVLGALNARGLSETLDVPRFVRTALALSPVEPGGDPGVRARAHGEQLVVLERLLRVVVPKPLDVSDDENHAFLRVIFAIGMARLGARPNDLVQSLRDEVDAHLPPNRALLALYLARLSHFVTGGTVETWTQEVDAALRTVDQAEHRRVVEWLVKRSRWLRAAPPPEPASGLRPGVEKLLAGVTKVDQIEGAVQAVTNYPGLYDYEVVGAYQRLAVRALASGREGVMADALAGMWKGLDRIRILAHRVASIGTCVNLAAVLEDQPALERCIDGIIAAAQSPRVPSVRELLVAVRPALGALRRLGASEPAARLLHSLEPIALHGTSGVRDAGPLLAAIAEGLLLLGDGERAQHLLGEALTRAFASATGYIDRHDAVQAVLESLAHWDLESRAAICARRAPQLEKQDHTLNTIAF
jgi:hypothetical protein